MKQLTLLVLAAGVGKRMKPLVTSKPLLPFLGKTLLEWVIESAEELKPNKIVVVVKPEDKDTVARLLPQAKIVVQSDPAGGMAGAILAAKKEISGPVVIVNGDDLIDVAILTDFRKEMEKSSEKVVLTGIKSDLPGGYFEFQGDNLKIIEKPAEDKKPSEWLKIVLDYFPSVEKFVSVLMNNELTVDDLYERALNSFKDLFLVKTKGNFLSLKYPHQVLDMTEFLLKKHAKDKSLIDPTAKVFPGAVVTRSYIGPQVVVGNNALVRDSIIEAGSEIGFCTEVARSYVGPKSFCHTNYVGDSVIEGSNNFGAGAVLANFRFDHKPIGITGRTKFGAVVGKGAQIGVNASLMPGTTVKAGETVGPGVVWK